MYCVIKELDKEGINLQETRLNLINQGYEWYWNMWLKYIKEIALAKVIIEQGKEKIIIKK